MTILIACLGVGKGTWTNLNRLALSEVWEKIYLVTDSFGKEKFQPSENMELILVDFRKDVAELKNDIVAILKEKIKDAEVALNLISGSGNEHMAILSALLQLGLGIRLVNFSEERNKMDML